MKSSVMLAAFPAALTNGRTEALVRVTNVQTDTVVHPWTAASAFPAHSHLRPFVDILASEPLYSALTVGCADLHDFMTIDRSGGRANDTQADKENTVTTADALRMRTHADLASRLRAAIEADLVWCRHHWLINVYVRSGQPAALSMSYAAPDPHVVPLPPKEPIKRRSWHRRFHR